MSGGHIGWWENTLNPKFWFPKVVYQYLDAVLDVNNFEFISFSLFILLFIYRLLKIKFQITIKSKKSKLKIIRILIKFWIQNEVLFCKWRLGLIHTETQGSSKCLEPMTGEILKLISHRF